MPTEPKRREKEQTLYRAALGLIADGRDWDSLTVQQIAAAADIGKGTVYEYFPSKEAILHGLTAYCIESELDRLEAAAAPCMTLSDLLDALLGYITDLVRDRAGIYRVVAGALGVPRQHEGCRIDAGPALRLRTLLHGVLDRLRQNGEVDAALEEEYCFYAMMASVVSCIVLLTAVTGAEAMPPRTVLESTRQLLRRALQP